MWLVSCNHLSIQSGVIMPYVNKPRPYKKEYQQQLERNEKPSRNARERARYEMDKRGVDRTGKDIDHVVPLSKGGSNARSNPRSNARSRSNNGNIDDVD